MPIMQASPRLRTKNRFFEPFRISSLWFFFRVFGTDGCGKPQRHL